MPIYISTYLYINYKINNKKIKLPKLNLIISNNEFFYEYIDKKNLIKWMIKNNIDININELTNNSFIIETICSTYDNYKTILYEFPII